MVLWTHSSPGSYWDSLKSEKSQIFDASLQYFKYMWHFVRFVTICTVKYV